MPLPTNPALAALTGLLVLIAPLSASAVTVSFDGVPPPSSSFISAFFFSTDYRESGVTVRPSGGSLAWKTHAGSVHLEDLSSTFAAGLSMSMRGSFSAASFVLTSLGYDLPVGNAPLSDNIFVTGYRGGQRVAWMGLTLPEAIGARATYSLGADFQDLDELTINIITPIDVNGCGTPCAQFDLEEVSLDPAQVPLPASLPMVLTGIAAIGAVRRRHRS